MFKIIHDLLLGAVIGSLLYLLALIFWAPLVHAQTCGPDNQGCLVPLPPQSDNSNRAAPTAWVKTFAPTIVVSGDITGTLAATVVSKIQGNTVTGTTGTGKVVFSTAPTIGSLSVTTGLNLTYLNTFAPGVRGPIFVWQNPPGTGGIGTPLLAGQNAIMQGWVGNNPTATPQVNDAIAVTFALFNGNYRGQTISGPVGIGVMNLLVGVCGPAEGCVAADYTDAPIEGLEIDIFNSTSYPARNRVFHPTSGSYNKIAYEAIINSGNGAQVTAAFMVWSPGANVNGAFYEGFAISRVSDIGIEFVADPDLTDTYTAFGVCAICDNSRSAAFLKFGNFTHAGYMIDASSGAAFAGGFYKGSGSGVTNFLIRNSANFDAYIGLDTGASTSQNSVISLNDRGVPVWQLSKFSSNAFGIFNFGSGSSDILVNLDDTVVFKSSITVGSPQLIASSVGLTNNAAALTATLTNSPTTGNPTKWIPINDNGTIRNIPAW